MNFDRLALAFWEAGNDLQHLRLIVDDTLEEIEAEKSKPGADRARLELLALNLNRTRVELGAFRALALIRVDECSPGIVARLARQSQEAAARIQRLATRGEQEAQA